MRVMKPATFFFFLAVVLSATGLSGTASADIITYAATALGDFGTLDLTTGQYSSIGPSGAQFPIVGMGFLGGTLYGVDNNPDGAGFYSIDTAGPTAGTAHFKTTLMDASGAPITAYGGTTVETYNGFFGITQNASANLFVTGSTGSPAGVGTPLGFSADGLVALGPGNTSPGNLYVSEFTGNPSTGDELHTITPTGVVTDIGGLNNGLSGPAEVGQQAITGLIFGSTLYAIDGNYIYTYTVSPTSVSALLTTTAISGLNDGGDQVFAVAPAGTIVPEPTSLVMGSIAIVAAGLVYARRRFLSA